MNVKRIIAWASLSLVPFVSPFLNAASYTITVDENTKLGFAHDELFGTNFVHTNNTLNNDFKNTFSGYGMKTMRYPGGTVTEHAFDIQADIANIGNSVPLNSDEAELKDFLDYCSSSNVTPILVVPTKVFANNVAQGAAEAREFVRRVNNSTRYGNHYVKYWEIGNEWYANPPSAPSITRDEYKVIAAEFSLAMNAEDSSIVPIMVSQGINNYGNNQLKDYLDNHANSVKGITDHCYPSFGNISNITWTDVLNADEQVDRQLTILENIESVFGFGEIFVTEWNMTEQESRYPGGMVGPSFQPSLFAKLVEGGVKRATQWPLMWNGNGVPSVLAKDDGTLLAQGQVFDWIATHAKGRDLLSTSTSSDYVKAVAFGNNNNEVTIFVMCRKIAAGSSIEVDINGFTVANIEAERLTREDPEDKSTNGRRAADRYTVMPSVNVSNGKVLFNGNTENEWEMIRITCKSSNDAFLFNLINRNSDKCLRPKNGSTANDQLIVQQTLNTSWNSMKWELRPSNSSGYYHIINKHSGHALRPKNSATGDNVQIVQYDFNANWDSMKWEIIENSAAGYFNIVNKHTGKALRPKNGGIADNVELIQQTLNAGWSSMQWRIEKN